MVQQLIDKPTFALVCTMYQYMRLSRTLFVRQNGRDDTGDDNNFIMMTTTTMMTVDYDGN